MKSLRRLASVTVIVLFFAACTDSGKLTKDKAEGALNRWISNGSVTVAGIQEVPQENIAKVDLNFSNFKYTPNTSYPYERNYSGRGDAIFTHYNDGRWVLTKVSISNGMASIWWNNLNIETK